MKERAAGLLAELGFTGVEAAAYLALLQEPGATGYRVSRLIGKPVPNTYKALDSLKDKGAVVMDDTARGRSYAALPIAEYLEGMKRQLDARRQSIEHELKGLVSTPMEGGIFQLTTVQQVYERVRAMLDNAKSIVLMDIFPEPLEELRPAIEAAARRGVKLLLMTYTPVEVKGCEVIAPKEPAPHLKQWNGDWMNVMVDCSEYVHSLLKKNRAGVHRAVWTRDSYLAIQAFSGALNEFMLNRMVQLLWADKSCKEIGDELTRMHKRYLSDSMFYDVVKPWLRESEMKDRVKKPGARSGGSGGAAGSRPRTMAHGWFDTAA
jgi:HTH-type transcriptional regulator, sugar sensing transcriptional regulator